MTVSLAQAPRVTLQVGDRPVSFMVDTGAAYSVLTEPMGPVTSKKTSVQEATRQTACIPWISKRTVDRDLPDFTKKTAVYHLYVSEPRIQFHKTLAINPASLLPDDDPEEPIHDCTEVTDAVQTALPDMTDVPLSSPDEEAIQAFSSQEISSCERREGPPPPQKGLEALPLNRVTLQVGGRPVSFLVDTRAAYSVLTEPIGPVTSKKTAVQEATRQIACFP
ncbi:hypothetical protein QTO34_014983 [Cnephaeus nilssonii]|uniref:Retropepsins domain-containing protein n=1 Tax=Cnephaeus nilssonii TaxID=3371016 RepID=A0AA40HA69_CNENI|nr:hypothetical protein QTO34_014983 [Eptesicus nilssonii]